MKTFEIVGVAVLSVGGGLLGAMIHQRYIMDTPEVPQVAVFDSGAFVMERMLAATGVSADRSAQQAVIDAARVADTLAGDGYIVLDNTAVISAPKHYYVPTSGVPAEAHGDQD